jgi:ferrous iron transport protein A
MEKTRLSTLGYGDHCLVAEISAENAGLRSRLYALGVIPGSRLQVLRFAPLGDPMQVKVGNSLISIRKSEAEIIEVELT